MTTASPLMDTPISPSLKMSASDSRAMDGRQFARTCCDIGSFVGVNVKQKLFPTPKTLPTFAKLYMWMTIGLRIAPKVLVVQLLVQLLVLLLAAHLEVLEVPEGNTDVDAIRKAIKAAAKLHGNKILKLFFSCEVSDLLAVACLELEILVDLRFLVI